MNWLKQATGYCIAGLGIIFIIFGLTSPFSEVEEGGNTRLENTVIGTILGGAFTLAGVTLIKSGKARTSDDREPSLPPQSQQNAISEQDRLRTVLYRLMEEKDGRFTLIQFAIAANVSADQAKAFLETQATAFNANFDVSDQGAIVYHFPIR